MGMDNGKILALDVGSARIGVALASREARIASPAGALSHDNTVIQQLHDLCSREGVQQLVIGLPRGLSGQDTDQTTLTRTFGEKLGQELGLPVVWQDEAVTSAQAEAELRARKKPYAKADIDALAATYILEDYLRDSL